MHANLSRAVTLQRIYANNKLGNLRACIRLVSGHPRRSFGSRDHIVGCTAAEQSVSKLHRRFSNRARKKPLVVLVGWLGAQKRHLLKYSSLWHDLGHPTLEILPRTSSILIPPAGDRQAASFLAGLEELRRQHQESGLLLHIFSNAGFLFVGTALRQLSSNDLQSQPAAKSDPWIQHAEGLIFDSAPARLTPDIAARGFVAAGLGKPALGIELQHPLLIKTAMTAFRPVLKSGLISQRSKEIWAAWNTAAPVCPQLYLCSADDALIPPSEVLHFQKLQAARGVDTSVKIWSESAHCEHLRRYPDEYREELQSFLLKCNNTVNEDNC